MRRCEDAKMRRCEDANMRRCEDAKMRRCDDDNVSIGLCLQDIIALILIYQFFYHRWMGCWDATVISS
jgi:hypothetical protein